MVSIAPLQPEMDLGSISTSVISQVHREPMMVFSLPVSGKAKIAAGGLLLVRALFSLRSANSFIALDFLRRIENVRLLDPKSNADIFENLWRVLESYDLLQGKIETRNVFATAASVEHELFFYSQNGKL